METKISISTTLHIIFLLINSLIQMVLLLNITSFFEFSWITKFNWLNFIGSIISILVPDNSRNFAMKLYLEPVPGSEINFCTIKSYVRGSPDSSTSSIVIQRSGSMAPRNVSGRLRYIADHTLQFYRTPSFVKFVTSRCPVLVHDLYLRHWNRRRFIFMSVYRHFYSSKLSRDIIECATVTKIENHWRVS